MDLNDSNGGFSKSVVKDPRHRSVVFSAFLSQVPGSGVDTRGSVLLEYCGVNILWAIVCKAQRIFQNEDPRVYVHGE